jgi:hypothetical protein
MRGGGRPAMNGSSRNDAVSNVSFAPSVIWKQPFRFWPNSAISDPIVER